MGHKSFLLIFLLIAVFFNKDVFSQTATVKGVVFDEETNEPVIFTNVYCYKTSYGASTDGNGLFVITKIPVGKYVLMVSAMGYDTLRVDVDLKSGDVISKKLFVKKGALNIIGVDIKSSSISNKTETKTSVSKITPVQIERIPSIGGQPDLAQLIQVLPGVVFTGDQGGQLYIRGGSPIQNKVLLDGMIIYNPFHSIGLFSVFDTDIIRNADVYTGGFGAEYGGRISSIMDITTRDGNKKRMAGKVSASTFGAKILVEGPLSKAKSKGKGSTSFIFSAKNSYLDESSKTLYEYVNEEGLPYTYTDLYGKVSFLGANGSKVNFFGFNFVDNVDYQAVSNYEWKTSGAGMNFVVIPEKTPMIMEGNFAFSQYGISIDDATYLKKSSEIDGFNLGLNFTYFSGKNQFEYGVELLGFTTSFDFYNSVNRRIEQKENTTELAGFLKYKWILGNMIIEPSLRLQYYATPDHFSLEPRLAMKYNVTDFLRIKFAGGYYSQNLIAANSDRDVVNLFYGFLSGPENIQDEFDGKRITHSLQKAEHVIFGFEVDIFKNASINIEGYYKNFSQLTNINRNKIYNDTEEYYDKPDYLRKDFIIETGDAEGVDFVFKYDHKRLYFWAVYSLGFINRFDGLYEYTPHFDRRHNVNLLSSYKLGETFAWEISARWNYGSGFPFTQTQGFYEKLTFIDGINSNITSENGDLGIQYAGINEGRLPYYHRLDFSVKRKFVISKNSILDATFSLTNVYDRKNIFYFDRVKYERVNQLPIMPSLGLSMSF